METITLKIRRQERPEAPYYWEDFKVSYIPGTTVINLLVQIQKKPVNARGEATQSVVYENGCCQGECGACTMLINGRPRTACSALVDHLSAPLVLEPLSKFPVIRDLVVDRSRFFTDLINASSWISADFNDPDTAPLVLSESIQKKYRELSACTFCGSCLEACPQYNDRSSFVGAAVIAQIRLIHLLPLGRTEASRRLSVMMEEGGVEDCGHVGNCVKACPEGIDLRSAIAGVEREVTVEAVRRVLG